MNYFRITAYNKEQNYSIIMDSYGAYEALWQFSSMLVEKGFSIIAVGNQDKFNDGDIPKVTEQTNKIILRAECHGQPIKSGNRITVGNKYYTTF